jgi:phytoene synthase
MGPFAPDTIPLASKIALGYCPIAQRGALGAALALDYRLSQLVARTTEVLLGQMRLAWWRETLQHPLAARPQGDAVLDAIGVHCAGREAALIAMIDGWEVFLIADNLHPSAIQSFGRQRSAFFGELFPDHFSAEEEERIAVAAFRWAIADAAAGVSDASERAALIAAGAACPSSNKRLPKALRSLAVLDALSRRALRRGGRPLMEGRGAPLVALKAAILLK